MPENEYRIRFLELKAYSERRKFSLITGYPDTREWVNCVQNFRYLGENSERCWKCYEYRLNRTFCKAAELGYDLVATTLSVSPHKNALKINEIGETLSRQYNINFYSADFKKNDGSRKAIEISRKNNFYRQKYCGCIYSKLERNSESRWSLKSREFRLKEINEIDKNEITSHINLGDEIDLHHFHPSDTKILVTMFIENAVKNNYKTLKIVHGKGKSVKKKQIYEILIKHPSVNSFYDDSYNWGSTIIKLQT